MPESIEFPAPGSEPNSEGRIVPTDLRSEMSRSYLEYAMSVIVGRALPDARDGLKPVHRRILYAMYELGLTAERPFRKCARVVGEVLGKYHPHGESAVYDALVRMAQDFSMRAPLIDGHGNFGSVDNDPPAAMRYTESRLQALSTSALLEDIESETVDFLPTFDGSQQEPTVLPARIPQLLLNGSAGIAVGMATNIPPHNLSELIAGLDALIEDPQLSDQELLQLIPGPDFPTGGQILGRRGIKETYRSGRGSIPVRGVATVETLHTKGRPDRDAVIITELPYQVNKAALIERIAELVNDKKLEGIADIRDESDREGMRVVIELRRDAYGQVVLNNLFKLTPLQANFSTNMVALVKGEPRLLTLRQLLETFLAFRIETIERRTRHLLRKAEERDHVLQGFLMALADLDEVIRLIRAAADTPTARSQLEERLGLSSLQSEAILQMQLRRLTALEADKIRLEHEDLLAKIKDYRDILAHRERVSGIIRTELEQLDSRFATERRTVILDAEEDLEDIDLIANERSVVLLTSGGYLKRMPVREFVATNLGTRGKAGTRSESTEQVRLFISCSDHDTLLLFSDRGLVYALPAYKVPIASRTAKGSPIVQLLPISREEDITSLLALSDFNEDQHLLMLTQAGFIKRTPLRAFANIRVNGLIAIHLEAGDALRWVRLARVDDSVLIGSRSGMAIHVPINDNQLRSMGRTARGVRAMALREGDQVIGMDVFSGDQQAEAVPWVLVASAHGRGKRVAMEEFPLQARAGMGRRALKFRGHDDALISLRILGDAEEVLLVSEQGVIVRLQADQISQQSRAATGVRLQKLGTEDRLVEVVLVPPAPEDDEDEGGDASGPGPEAQKAQDIEEAQEEAQDGVGLESPDLADDPEVDP